MLRIAGVRRAENRADHIVHAIGVGFTDIDDEMREQMAQSQALSDALTAAEEASKAKTAFLSSMSHEIRTPMNAIIGLDSIALNDPDISPQTREYLEKIGVSANHLLTLINDIETTREIRRIVGHESAIIIITAYRWDDVLEEAISAGVDSFIAKPLFANNIIEEFRSALQRKNISKPSVPQTELKGRHILLAEDVQRSLQAGMNAHLSKPIDNDALFAALESLIK